MSAVLSDLSAVATSGAGFSGSADNKPADPATVSQAVNHAIRAARSAQRNWSHAPLSHRLKLVRKFRHLLVERAEELVATVTLPERAHSAETMAAEVLPLADACKFLERTATNLLSPKRLSAWYRPAWLAGVQVTEQRDPFGVVLILGTWNYPLFLPGVQALHALVAGNAVLLKPGRQSTAAAEALQALLVEAGFEKRLITVLPESTLAAESAFDAGVDKVVLTGAAETGRKVLRMLAETLTPAEMELSGCDAVFVRGDADIDLVVQALSLGMTFNSSATCIAPRRVFVHRSIAAELEQKLAAEFARLQSLPVRADTADRLDELVADALRRGARLLSGRIEGGEQNSVALPILLADASPDSDLLQADVFAPVLSLVPVSSDSEALRWNHKCPYALGATVFGRSEAAWDLANQIDAGCVVINDFLIPTADPRVSFGGRRQSGFGVTRGAAGLLNMTQPKTIIEQTRSSRPYLERSTPEDLEFFRSYLTAAHGRNLSERLRAAWQFLREAYRRQSRSSSDHTS